MLWFIKKKSPANYSLNVTYWPSTQPSIKKQVHPVEDITLTCGRVEFGADATPIRSRCMSNNYITRCHRQFGELESVCWSASCSSRLWEPAPSRGLGPPGPPVEQPSRMRKKCYYSQRNLGSICCSLFSLQLTSHTQPFRNPFRIKYIFLKKCVRSSLLLIMFPDIYVCI